MDDTKKTHELFSQAGVKAVETLTVWADANQRVLRELVELSAASAKEGVRVYAELQQGALEATRDAQAATLRGQTTCQDAPKDPVGWYQRILVETIDGAQKTVRMIEANAQAVSRSAGRLQASAEQSARGIQETFTSVVTKLKDVHTRN